MKLESPFLIYFPKLRTPLASNEGIFLFIFCIQLSMTSQNFIHKISLRQPFFKPYIACWVCVMIIIFEAPGGDEKCR